MKIRLMPASREGRINALFGGLVSLFSLGVYAYCVTPTVPYWDSGEFIATSYILGIPHPPGTPLYVLIGRLVTLLPFSTVAVRVNLLSSLASAIAVLFTYLITVRLIRKNLGPEAAGVGWLPYAGGVVAAFFTAFAPTFWGNAIEAEVYGAVGAITCLCLWIALLWWDRQGEPGNDRLLLVIFYVLFLSIGIHLGCFLVLPAIYLLVTMVHWPRVKKAQFWGSVYLFLAALIIRFTVVMAINDDDPRITELSLAPAGVQTAVNVINAMLVLAFIWNMISVLGVRFALALTGLAVLGISVHLYLYIRAHLDPAINEADPSTWQSLKLMLLRDQYKPPEPIFRKAPWGYQFDYMYLRYFRWQFILSGLFNNATWIIPVSLGIFGALMNAVREKKSFLVLFTLFLVTGPLMVWYLNFKEGEVRERDYFFVDNFHFFAIWIGMGAALLAQAVSEVLRKPEASKRLHPVGYGLSGLFVLMSVMPLFAGEDNQNFFRHNRRGDFVAHDYAYNMLVGLEKDAIIFTNGDNDTFPLWYIQEVEHFRKDVRVLCLSLLNTDWCIKQARDYPPKVPINLTDDQIDRLQWYRDKNGKIWMVKDIIVKHIIETNQWKRPLYLAVTVPDHMGLEKQLSMEGLVFRIQKDEVKAPLDVEKTRDNLHNKYRYGGFLNARGEWDTSVYKDDQTTKLLQNYAAASVQLALQLVEDGRNEEAMVEMERARKIAPTYPGVSMALGMVYERMGRLAEARDHYEEVLKIYPDQTELLAQLGHVRAQLGDTAGAIRDLNRTLELAPSESFNAYAELVNIYYQKGDLGTCVNLLQRWLGYHPDDRRAQGTLEFIRRESAAPAFEAPGAGRTPAPAAGGSGK